MSDIFYCDVEVRPASMYVDPEPAEYCESEVENEGDLCSKHEPADDYDYRAELQREEMRYGE